MRLTSFRTRVLVLAIAFSVLLIGSVLITSYFVVVRRHVAGRRGHRARPRRARPSSSRASQVTEVQTEALEARARTDAAAEHRRDARARASSSTSLPELFRTGHGRGRVRVLRRPDRRSPGRVWSTRRRSDAAETTRTARARSSCSSSTIDRHAAAASALVRPVRQARTSALYTVHVPVDVPDGSRWVLDVVYVPFREEQTIDAIRVADARARAGRHRARPIAMMQMSMGWVLQARRRPAGRRRLDRRRPARRAAARGGPARDRRPRPLAQPPHRPAAPAQRGADALHRRREPRAGDAGRGHPRLREHPAGLGRRGRGGARGGGARHRPRVAADGAAHHASCSR